MNCTVTGPLAAALILAGVTGLGDNFNLDDGVLNRLEEEKRASYPSLDKDAIALLAKVDGAKQLAVELKTRQAETQAAVQAVGGEAHHQAVYESTKRSHKVALLEEVAAAQNKVIADKAKEDAEKEFLAEQGFARNSKGELVPVPKVAAPAPEPNANPAPPDTSGTVQ